jgi:hypothetical protein
LDDCRAAIAGHGVELRVVPSLWPSVDAVAAEVEEYSAVRVRNATPRPADPPALGIV